MKSTIVIDIDKREAEDLQGNAWNPPVATYGETWRISLRLAQNERELDEDLVKVRIGAGYQDQRPASGRWRLVLGAAPGTPTGWLTPNAGPAQVQSALNGIDTGGLGAATVSVVTGGYALRFANGGQAEIAIDAELSPAGFGRLFARETSTGWVHEIRLTSAPIAYGESSTRVLPEKPTITRVQSGGTDGTLFWNEVQALEVPPDFRGVYQLTFGNAKSGLISHEDGIDQITDALNGIKPSGFVVSNPYGTRAHIEFAHEDYEGQPQDLLELAIISHPDGDYTVDVPFTGAPLAETMRPAPQIEVPLEIWADVVVGGELQKMTLWQGEVTIRREVVFEELATDPDIDWLRPPSPRNYVPFTPDQIITGSQHWTGTIGDGLSTEITIDHGLGTDALHISVRENIAGGLAVEPAAIRHDSDDSVTLLFIDPPALNALAVVITAAGPTSAFQAHTHEIAQILGLQALLDNLDTRLDVVENLVPTASPGVQESDEPKPLNFGLSPIAELYPGRFAPDFEIGTSLAEIEQSSLPRVQGILPAIHDVTIEDYVEGEPAADHVGQVRQNNTGSTLYLPGAGGRRSVELADGEHVASDGRFWYKVRNHDGTTSYYSTDFERELCLLHINEYQLRVKRTLTLQLVLETRLFSRDKDRKTQAQWFAVVDVGTYESESTPATTGPNISHIAWESAPTLEHRIILTETLTIHQLGARIKRTSQGLTADIMRYGYWTGGAQAPSSPNFVIRARLMRFDTGDGLPDPRAFVGLVMPTAKVGGEAEEKNDTLVTSATII